MTFKKHVKSFIEFICVKCNFKTIYKRNLDRHILEVHKGKSREKKAMYKRQKSTFC